MPKGKSKEKRVYGARKESTLFFMNSREARDLIRALRAAIKLVPDHVKSRLRDLLARIEKSFEPLPR